MKIDSKIDSRGTPATGPGPVPELHEDPALAGLLRQAGRRPSPAAAVEAEVRAAVAAEWRRVVADQAARRRARQRPVVAGVLALAAAVAGVAVLVLRESASPVAPVAALAGTVSHVAGPVQFAAAPGAAWQTAARGATLPVGSVVATGPGGRLAIGLPGGGELRLDEATRVAFVGREGLELEQGATYFDTGADGARAAAFAITTRRGVIRHLGTQFQVRAAPGAGPVSVSIREGRVEVATAAGRLVAPAGERLTLLADGSATRTAVAPTDPEWSWTQAAAPPFDIEQRSLAEFLAWVARETGAELEFATPADRAAAAEVRLRGSVEGLTPEQSLRAVMATTRFDYRMEGARLAVARRR